MSLQPMPIASAIRSGTRVYDSYSAIDNRIDRSIRVRPAARSSTMVNAQVAADMFWLGKNEYSRNGDFPPLRLPFPDVWIEWTMPETFWAEGEWHELPVDGYRQFFALATCIDPSESSGCPEGTHSAIQVDGGWMEPGGVYIPAGLAFANLDERGRLIGGRDNGDVFDGVVGISADADLMAYISLLHPAFLAIGLMNCSNVKTEAESFKSRSSNRLARKAIPKLDYHTIVLPGSRSGGSGTSERQGVMPQHKVRGHFKTFTVERPLMGRHVGTYWWGWNVRGNKKNGITVTDYKVGAA